MGQPSNLLLSMAIKIGPLVIASQSDKVPWGSIVASDPVTGSNGQVILNSSDNEVKVWYNGSWNIWFRLTSGVPSVVSYYLTEDGFHYLLEDDSGAYIME